MGSSVCWILCFCDFCFFSFSEVMGVFCSFSEVMVVFSSFAEVMGLFEKETSEVMLRSYFKKQDALRSC